MRWEAAFTLGLRLPVILLRVVLPQPGQLMANVTFQHVPIHPLVASPA